MMSNIFFEHGKQGLNHWSGMVSEEFLPELGGIRGVRTYQEMADNDDMVGASLFAIEMMIRQVSWDVDSGGNKPKDEDCRQFILTCMEDLDIPWTDFISEVLSFLTYGWSWHEIVYKRRCGNSDKKETKSKYDDKLIGWQKLPIRGQDTLDHWEIDPQTDDLLGLWQSPPPTYGKIFIPTEKSLHFRTKSRKGNPEGRSILRTAYRSWFAKKRIQELEGIGIERDLAGLPYLRTPEGLDLYSPENTALKSVAEQLIRTIKRDENEGVLLPYGWELSLLTTGGSRQHDTNEIIARYDKAISATMMTDFLLLGHEGVGSYALSSDKTSHFARAIGTYLDMICQVFNTQAIPRLIELNGKAFGGISDYPKLIHGDIESRNLEELGEFVKSTVGCGILTPDETLEDYLRREAGLPERDELTTYGMMANTGVTYQPQED